MQQVFSLSQPWSNYQPKIKQNSNSVSKVKKTLVYSAVALNAMLLFAYLFGVNSYAASGYEMKKIQTSVQMLNEENKKLSLKISEQSSLATLHTDLQNSIFVPVVQTKFLQVNQLTQR